MRWVIGILLVLNLLVLLLPGVLPEDDPISSDLPEPDVGNLRLISERVPGSRASNDDVVTSPLGQPDSFINEPALVDQRTERIQEQVKQVPPKIAQVAPSLMPKPKPPVQAEPAKPEPVITPPLKTPLVGTQAASLAPGPQSQLQQTVACWLVGSFPGESQANTAALALPAGIRKIGVEQAQAPKVVGYYVLVPAASSQADAEKTLAQLKSKGIRDTWLFRSGQLKNAISLGLFSTRANAERQIRKVSAKGFEAVLRPKQKGEGVYRLKVAGTDSPANRKSLKRIGDGFSEKVDCPR